MKTYICGHKNPDTDSVMSAYALADLRKKLGMEDVEAISAGRLPEKSAWVFEHFKIKPISVRSDVYVRVCDIIDQNVPMIDSSMKLDDALRLLETSGESSLPVKDVKTGDFLGMLSPAKLLSLFIAKADLSIPVSQAPLLKDTLILLATDRVHDIKSAAVKNSHNHFPVVDENGKLLGTILKRAFAEKPPAQMILVDHNEIDQAIPGVEELPVIEVVDHHRIAIAPTTDPIKYTADVVGSTCTLVAKLFRGAGLRPTKETAGALIAGIVSDTLLFQSPTTTDTDRTMCAWLEKVCGESADEVMSGLMSMKSPIASMPSEQVITLDAKTYTESGRKFILSQIEETKMTVFHNHAPDLLAAMERLIKSEKLDFMALMVTDPVRGDSELLFSGNESVRRILPYRRGKNGTFLMPGILSRKKQLLPEILAALA